MKRLARGTIRTSGVRVTGLVLAGGRGRRVGGKDKGLMRDRGVPMAVRAARWLAPHSDRLVISANRHLRRYGAWADLVVADHPHERLGPLAGVSACLGAVTTRWLLTCPCDAARLPPDLPPRLLRALRLNGSADAAVVRDAERRQPLVAAFRGGLGPALARYLAAGGRSAYGWLDTLNVVEVRTPGVIGNRNR